MIVRRPRTSEWPACRMLLPAAFEQGGRPEFLLAAEDAPPRILGAASFRRYGGITHSVQIHVAPRWRRQSIGSALLAHVIEEARRAGDREIAANVAPERDPDTRAFLLARGFTCKESLVFAEVDIEVVRQVLCAAAGRRRKMPASASIAALDPAHIAGVVRLYEEYILEDSGAHTPLLRSPQDAHRLRHSQVLLVDGKIEGVLLIEIEGGVAKVPGFAVTAKFQRSWAAPLLLAAGLEKTIADGAHSARFQYIDGNRKMMSLARHFKPKLLGALAQFVCEIGPVVR